MSPLLQLHEVSTGYGGVQALWNVSLSVEEGELCCVLGPNGAGKSTLARVLAGSIPVWSGAIEFGGATIDKRTPEWRARAGISHVPQGRRVFTELTVEENLSVARFAAGDRASADTEAFVYDLFPKLAEMTNRLAGTLSGGEQQMLAVGRALMAEPALLILDEPSLGLAPVLVQSLYTAIERIRDRGTAILLVEQAVEAALSVAHTAVLLESGRTTRRGPVAEFGDPREVARAFLGVKP